MFFLSQGQLIISVLNALVNCAQAYLCLCLWVLLLCVDRLRQQALELNKRKAVESAQTAADLKLHLDKYHAQLKEAQVAVADKTSALQQQSFKFKRIQVWLCSSWCGSVRVLLSL